MALTNDVLGIIPGLQSASLLVRQAKVADRAINSKHIRNPNYKAFNRDFIKGTTSILVGVPLISATSSMIK